jgi:serine/threonine-protein kinase
VLAEIAVGETARVDLCRVTGAHPRAGVLVAVKRLHPHVAEDPTFVRQFLDEVRITHWLHHPNVVEVAGWGKDEQGSYLAVELVQGVSLLRLMKTIFDTGEAFTERMVVYVAARVCAGLAAAHSLRAPNGEMLNLVHRDLTPSNILVGFNGEVKITDFGMAKAKQRLTRTLTGMRKGEPTYMAPEQASSDEIDARADLFSLGVILFELFAGRRPWIASNDYQMVQITTREPPADLRELRPKIDRELVLVVNRCLERDPAARFQSAYEIGARLEEWLSVHGYQDGNDEALGRFVRRNAMRQMRWFERAVTGALSPQNPERDPHPRVPTYTDHSQPQRPSEPPPDPQPPRPPPPPVGRAVVPPRPADPRSIRAANAVQQLKKLAPPVEPARGRRRAPTLDEDVKTAHGRAGERRGVVSLLQDDEEEEATGEDAPTLVQKGDAKLAALRAEAREQRGEAKPRIPAPRIPSLQAPSPARPAVPVLPVAEDEETDERDTDVRNDRGLRSALPNLRRIADPESELPTAPRPLAPPAARESRGGARDAGGPPNPALTPDQKVTPVNGGVHDARVNVRRPTLDRSPAMRAIPPSPEVPQRPFPIAPRAPPSHEEAQGPRSAPPHAPHSVPPQSLPPPAPPSSGGMDPRFSMSQDDAQVLERSALSRRPPGGAALDDDALIAEADRLAIEAVRCSEEARAAQLRAERKAAAARYASEAAMIAADAVRMLRTDGLAAARSRLDEARTLEQALQSGKIPLHEITMPLRMSNAELTPPASMPPASLPPQSGYAPMQPAPQAQASGQPLAPVSHRASVAPPPAPPIAPPIAHGPPNPGPIPASPPIPAPHRAPGPVFAGAAADPHRAAAGAPLAPPASPNFDAADFRASLKPSLLNLSTITMGGLVIAGVLVVVLLVALMK